MGVRVRVRVRDHDFLDVRVRVRVRGQGRTQLSADTGVRVHRSLTNSSDCFEREKREEITTLQ